MIRSKGNTGKKGDRMTRIYGGNLIEREFTYNKTAREIKKKNDWKVKTHFNPLPGGIGLLQLNLREV